MSRYPITLKLNRIPQLPQCEQKQKFKASGLDGKLIRRGICFTEAVGGIH
jgi:hypothetical protein